MNFQTFDSPEFLSISKKVKIFFLEVCDSCSEIRKELIPDRETVIPFSS